MKKTIENTVSEKSEEQKHYEHTKSFFHWALGITGTLIAIIASVSLYFTYNNMSEYKKELLDALKESKSDIKEMVSNANTTLKETKEQSYQLGKDIQSEAQRNISYIRDDAKSLALTEAERRVNDAFKEKNIQKVIDETAQKEIELRVKEIVSRQLKENSTLIKVMISVDRINNGDGKSFRFVDSISKYSTDIYLRMQADSIVKMKVKDWDNYSPPVTSVKMLNEAGCVADEKGNQLFIDSTENSLKRRVELSKSFIAKENDLYCISSEFEVLRFITKKQIRMFDFDAVKQLQFEPLK